MVEGEGDGEDVGAVEDVDVGEGEVVGDGEVVGEVVRANTRWLTVVVASRYFA